MTTADRRAARALNAVDETATTQLAALAALDEAIAAADAEGVARGLLVAFRSDRQQAFVRFHEHRLSTTTGDMLAAAFDHAIAFTVGVAGEGAEAAALRERKAQALAATSPPTPWFARFLEGQQR